MFAHATPTGNLTLTVELSPYLKQTPVTLALRSPTARTSCPLLPGRLGGVLEQTVDVAAGCSTKYVYQELFAAAVADILCWDVQPGIVETGPSYQITFTNFATQVRMIGPPLLELTTSSLCL